MEKIKAFDILKNTLSNTKHEDWRVPKAAPSFNSRYRIDLDADTTIEAIPFLLFFIKCDIDKWNIAGDQHDHIVLSERKFNPILSYKISKKIRSKRKIQAEERKAKDYKKLLSEIPNDVLKELGINIKD